MITTFIALVTMTPVADVSGTVLSGGKPVKDAVVWLKGRAEPKPISADIEQKNKSFVPRILVVPTGSTVGFPNRDDLFHNVFAEYQAKKFDLGMFPRGQTRKVKFDKPGVVSVLCNVHSEMSAFVVVVDTPFYTATDKKGKFNLKGMAPGTYTLGAWHESGKTASIKVDVGSSDVSLQVALQRG